MGAKRQKQEAYLPLLTCTCCTQSGGKHGKQYRALSKCTPSSREECIFITLKIFQHLKWALNCFSALNI